MSRMKIPRRARWFILLLAALAVGARGVSQPVIPRSPEAQRVFDALDRLRRAAAQPPPARLRSIVLTDQELNAYIGYRIRSEKAGALRDLRLKVFPGNRVEGLMFFDLTKIGAPSFLPATLRFYFSGRLNCRDARMKFEVQELFLEFKPVPVFLLNMAFYIASKTQKHGPAGLADWYELPWGIKDIAGETGRIILRY